MRAQKNKKIADCDSENLLEISANPTSAKSVTPKFYGHLKKLALARRKTAEVLEKCSKEGRLAEAAVSVAWELLFDLFALKAAKGLELSELNTLAGIIQKLAAGEGAAKSLSQKLPDAQNKTCGLSEDGVRQIEEMLKLL